MKDVIKYWLLGILIIVVAFLSFSAPSQWGLYLETLITTPIMITLQQSAFLILGGCILGSALAFLKVMFT